jgi:hypothetical protein
MLLIPERGALKLHTLFNIRRDTLIIESDGKTHDIEAARLIDWDEYAKGSIFVADNISIITGCTIFILMNIYL